VEFRSETHAIDAVERALEWRAIDSDSIVASATPRVA
jgi:hypothetical protein